MSQTIFTTERLRLRLMTINDLPHLLKIFADPIAMAYYPSTRDEEGTKRWIQWTLDNYENYGVGLWIVEDKETGQFLGQCGIVPQEINGTTEMEIGYLFVRDHWGKGYATEAALGCKKYGFDTLKLNRLISLIDPNNIPSINVAKRVGMTLDKQVSRKDKDILVFAIEATNK